MMRDLSKANGPVQYAEWARENLREALRDLHAKLAALARSVDDMEREEGQDARNTETYTPACCSAAETFEHDPDCETRRDAESEAEL